jgi:hypothetical protein
MINPSSKKLTADSLGLSHVSQFSFDVEKSSKKIISPLEKGGLENWQARMIAKKNTVETIKSSGR